MSNDLTKIQERFLFIIRDFAKAEGMAPTRRELAKLGRQKSTHGVNQILLALEKKGYIRIDPPGKRRNIVVERLPTRQLVLPGT